MENVDDTVYYPFEKNDATSTVAKEYLKREECVILTVHRIIYARYRGARIRFSREDSAVDTARMSGRSATWLGAGGMLR